MHSTIRSKRKDNMNRRIISVCSSRSDNAAGSIECFLYLLHKIIYKMILILLHGIAAAQMLVVI